MKSAWKIVVLVAGAALVIAAGALLEHISRF
jgi:hypothetical protein